MNVKISYKKACIGMLLFFILIGVGMIYFTKDIKAQRGALFINGPHFYPIFIASLLMIFCVISIIKTIGKPDKIIEIPNAHKAIATFVIIFVWALLWQLFGMFYLFGTLGVGSMMYILNPEPISPRKIRNTILCDAAIMICMYLIFTVGLKTSLR